MQILLQSKANYKVMQKFPKILALDGAFASSKMYADRNNLQKVRGCICVHRFNKLAGDFFKMVQTL